jgi:hypothetical protein
MHKLPKKAFNETTSKMMKMSSGIQETEQSPQRVRFVDSIEEMSISG